jgi:uncharacterized protein DUF899
VACSPARAAQGGEGANAAQRRRELPWVRIEKDYRFETDDGPATLADLFRGRSQLLVYHFMFGPEYTGGCPACSSIAVFFILSSQRSASRLDISTILFTELGVAGRTNSIG